MSAQTAHGALPSEADIAAAIEARLNERGVTPPHYSAFIGAITKAVVRELRAGLAHFNNCGGTECADDRAAEEKAQPGAQDRHPQRGEDSTVSADESPWIDFDQPDPRFVHPATRGLYDAIRSVNGVTACAIAFNTALETKRFMEGRTLIELPYAHACIVVMPHDIHPSQHEEIARAIGDNLPHGIVTIGDKEAEWTGHDGDRRIVRWFDETLGGRNPYLTFTDDAQEPQP